jgi:hypothetical protein
MVKKVLTVVLMWLTLLMICPSGYSQDTTSMVNPENGIPLASAKPKRTSRWDYAINLSGRKVSGYTDYHIQFPISYGAWPGVGHSILAFPTDGYRIEVSGLFNLRASRKDTITFELAMSKAITTPKESMVDSDYIYISAFTPPQWTFSATKSDVKYSNYDLRVTTGYPFRLNPQLKMTTIIGFQTSHNSYDLIGLSGWQEYTYGDKISIPPEEFAGIKVGTYKVDYHQLITGLSFETVPNKGLSLYLKGYFFPYVKAKDLDDHVLRMRQSTTNATGKGYQVEGRVKIEAHRFASGSTLNWGGGYNMLRITAKGSQIQKYYADSPDFSYDETGMQSEPIDNTLKLRQNSFSVFIEYKL